MCVVGRRNGIQRAQGADLSAFDPEVQKKVNELANIFLDEATKRVKDKVEKGAFKALTLPALLKEIRGMLRSIAKPQTTLAQINVPISNQVPQQPNGEPARVIDATAETDPAKIATLRKAQQRHLENAHGPPEG